MIFIDHKEYMDGKIVFVDIKGALNSETSADFEAYINQLLVAKKFFIIFDAKNLEYISSAGIGAVLYIQKKILAARGFFIICSISEEISALYEVLGFNKIIKVAGSVDEAVNTMEKQLKLIESERIEGLAKENAGKSVIADLETEKRTGSSERTDPYSNESAGENIFEHPIILECASCKSMIRVKRSGNYICPDCKTEFMVESDQTVVF